MIFRSEPYWLTTVMLAVRQLARFTGQWLGTRRCPGCGDLHQGGNPYCKACHR